MGYRFLDTTDVPQPDESFERDLEFAGVVGMIDPPRPQVPAAVADAQRARLRVIMITGDHPRTAARIAIDLGIAPADTPAVVTGLELEPVDADALVETVRRSPCTHGSTRSTNCASSMRCKPPVMSWR